MILNNTKNMIDNLTGTCLVSSNALMRQRLERGVYAKFGPKLKPGSLLRPNTSFDLVPFHQLIDSKVGAHS